MDEQKLLDTIAEYANGILTGYDAIEKLSAEIRRLREANAILTDQRVQVLREADDGWTRITEDEATWPLFGKEVDVYDATQEVRGIDILQEDSEYDEHSNTSPRCVFWEKQEECIMEYWTYWRPLSPPPQEAEENLPTLASLAGAAPKATEKMSEDFIREIRDEWQGPREAADDV